MINWHGQLPILSVDIDAYGRIATAAEDGRVRVRSAGCGCLTRRPRAQDYV